MSVWVGEGVIGSRCEGEAMAAACQSIDVDETWHLGGCVWTEKARQHFGEMTSC